MTKNEIIQYVIDTPDNSNPNVLRSMLDELPAGGDSDFEIFNIQIINNSNRPIIMACPYLRTSENIISGLAFAYSGNNEIKIVAYNGHSSIITIDIDSSITETVLTDNITQETF